jgi:anti-sigma regulatory factor (Ser/Thr protein kinase)
MRWLAHSTARAGGAGAEVANDIFIAMGEVLSNAARYAYPNSVGSLEIDYHLKNGKLDIRVQNHGGPITDAIAVPQVRPPVGVSGGLGLYAVGQLMDDVEVSLNADGNGVAVRMSRYLT